MDGLAEHQDRRLDLADMVRAALYLAPAYHDEFPATSPDSVTWQLRAPRAPTAGARLRACHRLVVI